MAELAKLKIVSFSDETYGTKEGTYELQINPTQYTLSFKQAGGTKSGEILANGSEPPTSWVLDVQDLNLEFYLDSTGVIDGCTSVPSSIEDFKSRCVKVNGSIHTSNYLKIFWGDSQGLSFRCKLQNLDIEYILFNRDGVPIRAKLKATFKGFVDAVTKANESNLSSPDLSHVKVIRAGDSLVALCAEIYGDPGFYLQVAEVNELLNFRNLKVGQRILFPALQK